MRGLSADVVSDPLAESSIVTTSWNLMPRQCTYSSADFYQQFRNVFGESAGARALPAFVALSNMGNVLAVSFAHSRLNQEFAKEGLLPFSRSVDIPDVM